MLAGVIGDPIGHSRSPALHGHWLRRYGIRGHYVPLHVEHTDIDKTLALLPKVGFRGVNVTIPHKEYVLRLAETVTDRAALIGAANTLTFKPNGGFHADNTDGIGFLASIKQTVPDWRPADGPAVVLGAGGASRAIISALISEGAPSIILANRTRARADALRQQFGARIEVVDWTQLSEAVPSAATIVNTTSMGMTGTQSPQVDFASLRDGTVVNDLVYTPIRTDFLQAAESAGARVVDGLGMLLHQAAPGFERWFGRQPDVDDELRIAVLQS